MIYNALNYKPTIAHIDLAAVQHNCRVVKNKAPNSKILAMVKSNAYGHGVLPIAKALSSHADAFGIAWLDEAIKLIENGIDKPMLLLKGFLTKDELQLISELQLSTVVHNLHQIELIEKTSLKNPIQIWLKVDTGLHRLGLQPQELESVYQKLLNNPKIIKPLFLITHLANADNVNDPKNADQIALFNNITKNLPVMKSIANSATLCASSSAQSDWVRSGILLYGASPYQSKTGAELGLKPVMTLVSQLLSIQHLKKGESVGYGSTWECPENMPVGIVNLGYGDGYPRHAKSGTPVLINNCRSTILGRVSMDMLAIDLRPCQHAQIGDTVTLWGKGLPIEEVAKFADTIPYELFCRLTQRVYFQYHE